MYIHMSSIVLIETRGYVSISIFCKNYFDGLPLEIDSNRHFGTCKAISESKRIFC